MKQVMPRDLVVGTKIQFDDAVGVVVSNTAAKPCGKYDLHSRIIEVAFEGKQNLSIRLKGSDAMNVVQ